MNSAPARERALRLMEREHRKAAEASGEGPYIELLDAQLRSTGPAQDLMETRLVPRIYERLWRPALGRAVKGPLGPSMAGEARIASELLRLAEGDAVLDVACGPGNFSRRFAPIVRSEGLVVGIDGSPTMLSQGAAELEDEGIENVALVRGNAMRLPFKQRSFDAVCCFAALHLFSDPLAALDEMTLVLKPWGRLAIMTSVRRFFLPPPASWALERLSGAKLFERGAIVEALLDRGYEEIEQRVSGAVQFVGGTVAG
jgi:ubiquinone/menaquinone biosynthesis C-methylase UbiE